MVYNTTMQPKYYGAAAEYNKGGPSLNSRVLRLTLLVLGIIVLITVAYFIVSLISNGPRDNAARLLARNRQLLVFMANNQKSLNSEDTKTVTTNAISFAYSDNYAISQGLATNYNLTTVPDVISKSEVDTTSAALLTTATINSRFDAEFVQLLRDKIAADLQLAHQVQGSVGGTLKAAVGTAIGHLNTTDEQLARLKL